MPHTVLSTIRSNSVKIPTDYLKMSTANINLNELYFKYKVLTKIIGKSTFTHLHKNFRELKANTADVPCTLGCEANGYLGMIVSTVQYETVAPATPITAPVIPTALVIDPASTQYQN